MLPSHGRCKARFAAPSLSWCWQCNDLLVNKSKHIQLKDYMYLHLHGISMVEQLTGFYCWTLCGRIIYFQTRPQKEAVELLWPLRESAGLVTLMMGLLLFTLSRLLNDGHTQVAIARQYTCQYWIVLMLALIHTDDHGCNLCSHTVWDTHKLGYNSDINYNNWRPLLLASQRQSTKWVSAI